jgi:hypothetical protein
MRPAQENPGTSDPGKRGFLTNNNAPLHVLGVQRPELREIPEDPTSLPTDRLELYFILKREFKQLLLVFHEVYMSSAGARDGARILERAAYRFARTAKAFADADLKEKA